MRRAIVAFSALTLVGLGLTGCGLFRFEQREAWRTEAEEACLARKLVVPTAYMSRTSEIDGPGACGISYPFKVAAFADGTVGLTQRLTLACPIIPHIDQWLEEVVQPAAALYFGTRVADLRSGSYSCRPRNNQRGAKVSEHAFGNAVDVMAFRFADGHELTVEKGWRGTPEEQDFLREVFVGACRYFTTVLAPGADPFHYNHIHIDLARHDARGKRHICKPIIKFTPRLDLESGQRQTPAPARPAPETARPSAPPEPYEQAPVDVEEDDPFAVSAPAAAPRAGYASAAPTSPRPYAGPPAGSPRLTPPPERFGGPVPAPLTLHPQPQFSTAEGLY